MPKQPDFFRDTGIFPDGISPPPETVRASFSSGHKVGQYLFTAMMTTLGLGMAVLFTKFLDFPVNVIAAVGMLAAVGYLIFIVTRNDYAWVELKGNQIRAQHLYTRRIVERSVSDVKFLDTIVIQVMSPTVMLVEAWLGRVRGVMVRFQDNRTPLQVCRTDPAMKNAKELIEAIIYRMSEIGEVEADIVDMEGKPLIKRIRWKKASAEEQ